MPGDGVSSSVIRKHKGLIKAYIEELGSRSLFDEKDPNDDAEERYCGFDAAVEGAVAQDLETQCDSEPSLRPKAEIELPVKSIPPLNFDTKPSAAFHIKTESRSKENPIDDHVSRVDSEPEPKAELRWMWLSNKSDGKNEESPAEEVRVSKVEHNASTTTTDKKHDRSNDAGGKLRDEFRLLLCDELDELRYKETLARDHIYKVRVAVIKQESSRKNGKREIRNEYDELEFNGELALYPSFSHSLPLSRSLRRSIPAVESTELRSNARDP